MKILVVDDEESVREVLREVLLREGHQIEEAGNGREALERVRGDASIDLVITDIMMPEMRGIDLIESVRALRPGVKIIAITGGGRVRDEGLISGILKLSEMVGVDYAFSKPFSIGEISEAVRALAGR